MLCNDVSSNVTSVNGRTQCPMEGLPVDSKAEERRESSSDLQMAMLATPGDRLHKRIPSPGNQSNWQMSDAESRLKNVEQTANAWSGNSDRQIPTTEKVLLRNSPVDGLKLESEMLTDVRHVKRVADCSNLKGLKKRIRLDENSAIFDPQVAQPVAGTHELWKKDALGFEVVKSHRNVSESLSKDVTQCSKDDLSQRLTRLDSAILHNEMALAKIRNTLEQLEESVAGFNKESGQPEEGEIESQKEALKPQLSHIEEVMTENRRKADASHAFLNKMKSLTESLMYQRPSDTAVYHENKHKFLTFKKRLVAFLKNKGEAQKVQSERFNEKYNRLHEAWKKKMELVESNQKQRAKKLREYFDKIFPEMRKQEEEKIQRYCSTVSKFSQLDESADDVKETADKTDVQTEVMQKLKSLAAQPPPLLNSRSRRFCFFSENGLVEDPSLINNASILKCSFWTDHEKEIFTEKYVRHPKKFGLIASFLENKTVQDCVQFYYLMKKDVGFKKLQRQKYSRKPRIRGATNSTKEDKTDNKNSALRSSCEQLLPSKLRSTNPLNVSDQTVAMETEQDEDILPVAVIGTETNLVGQASEGGRTSSLEPSTHNTSIQSEPCLTRLDSPSEEKEKILAKDVAADTSEQINQVAKIESASDETRGTCSRSNEEEEDWPEKMQDLGKTEDDAESVATLSADETGGHSQDDEGVGVMEKVPSHPLQSAEEGLQSSTVASLPNLSHEELQFSLPKTTKSDAVSRLSLQGRDEELFQTKCVTSVQNESECNISATATNTLFTNPMNESQGMVRLGGADASKRPILMPQLMPVVSGTSENSQRTYSPLVGNRCSGSRASLPVAGLTSFARSTGSPTRIRDLIHAAIEKNLQVIDGKLDVAPPPAKRSAESKKCKSSNDLFHKPSSAAAAAAAAAVVMDTFEVQDLSMHSSRQYSSSTDTSSAAAGRLMPVKAAPTVESPYLLRPAHSHFPDPKTGYLIDLALAAEYDNVRRSDGDQRKSDREAFPTRFETSVVDDPFSANSAGQAWKRREEHTANKGSIMLGTPISASQHSRIQASLQSAETRFEKFGVLPSSMGCNPQRLPEPVAWPPQPKYRQVVPHVSSEHIKLLHDDFLTAQQLRNMHDSFSPADFREQHPHYDSYQDVPSRAAFSSQNDPYAAEMYQTSRNTPTMRIFPGANPSFQPRQVSSIRSSNGHEFVDETNRGGGRRLLSENPTDSSLTVKAAFRKEPPDAECRGFPQEDHRRDRLVEPARNPTVVRPDYTLNKPEQVAWPKISEGYSAAQLIEAIIYDQISKPEFENKIESSTILKQIDDRPSASFSDSVFKNTPMTFRSHHLRDEPREQAMPRTASRSEVQEPKGTMGGRTAEMGFRQSAAVLNPAFVSNAEISKKGVRLPERGFLSDTGIPGMPVSSGMSHMDKSYPFGNLGLASLPNQSNNKRDCNQYQERKVITLGEGFDAIIEDMTRHHSNLQKSVEDNQFVMRNFLASSESIAQKNAPQLDSSYSKSSLNQRGVSSPRPSTASRTHHKDLNILVAEGSGDTGTSSSIGRPEPATVSQSSAGFNWKTKILREHQKQQKESQENDLAEVSKSCETDIVPDIRQHLGQPSASELSTYSSGDEGSSLARTDGPCVSGSTVTMLSSPADSRHSAGGQGVLDDHHSTIAASHQMMSTLLSNRSGRQPGRNTSSSSSSSTAGPNLSNQLQTKQATGRDTANSTAAPSGGQADKRSTSPTLAGSESPTSDSPGLEPPGRLIIRMDSAEDLQSPSLIT